MPNHTKLEFDTLTSLSISYIIIIVIVIVIIVRQTKIENFMIKNLNIFFIYKFIYFISKYCVLYFQNIKILYINLVKF